MIVLCYCSFDSSATVVPCHQDISHFQNFNSILNHGQRADIRRRNNICNISEDKKFSKRKSKDLIGRNSRIRAANPEIGRFLRRLMFEEEIRIFFYFLFGPVAIMVENSFQIGEIRFRNGLSFFINVVFIDSDCIFDLFLHGLEIISVTHRSKFLGRLKFLFNAHAIFFSQGLKISSDKIFIIVLGVPLFCFALHHSACE